MLQVQVFYEPIKEIKLSDLEPGDFILTQEAEYRIFLGPVTSYILEFSSGDVAKISLKKIHRKHVSVRAWTRGSDISVVNPRDVPLVSRLTPAIIYGRVDLEDAEKTLSSFLRRLAAKEAKGVASISYMAKPGETLPRFEWVNFSGGFNSFLTIGPMFAMIPKKDGGWLFYKKGIYPLVWEVESDRILEDVLFSGEELIIGQHLNLDYSQFSEMVQKDCNLGEAKVFRLI